MHRGACRSFLSQQEVFYNSTLAFVFEYQTMFSVQSNHVIAGGYNVVVDMIFPLL
jgi:hypothetical protein